MKHTLRKLLGRYLYKSSRSRALFTLYGIVAKEIRVSFSQFFTVRNPFTIFRVFVIIISSITRLLHGRYLKFSFAYTGEDRIIESILKPLIQYNGFYIDLGCNHPIHISNTYGLYRKGWRGICIDANKDLIKKYKFYRPKDIAIHALVSNEEGLMDFYLAENDGLSTAYKENLKNIKGQGIQTRKIELETVSLTKILKDNSAPRKIDLLSIDIEEYDLKALKSLDFKLYRPRLIVLEDESFDPNNPRENEIYQLLKANGYELEGFILKNLYFLCSLKR